MLLHYIIVLWVWLGHTTKKNMIHYSRDSHALHRRFGIATIVRPRERANERERNDEKACRRYKSLSPASVAGRVLFLLLAHVSFDRIEAANLFKIPFRLCGYVCCPEASRLNFILIVWAAMLLSEMDKTKHSINAERRIGQRTSDDANAYGRSGAAAATLYGSTLYYTLCMAIDAGLLCGGQKAFGDARK